MIGVGRSGGRGATLSLVLFFVVVLTSSEYTRTRYWRLSSDSEPRDGNPRTPGDFSGVSKHETASRPARQEYNYSMSSSSPGKLTDHVSLGVLTRAIPRFVVDEVLLETERWEKRSRSLPAHVVVYFVVALSVFSDSYEEVIRKLVNGMRFARTWSRDWKVPTTSALSQARVRLGEKPLAQLFDRVAVPVAKAGTPGAWLGRWRLMAIDGVMIDIPDTPENVAEYDKAEGGTRRPFPQTRTVGLSECGTHAVLGAAMGTIRQGERHLAMQLTSRISPDMLITADRGFYSFELFREYLATGAQLLWRLWKTVHLDPVTVLPDGSYLAEITSQHGRAGKTRIPLEEIDNPRLATHLPVRVVEYQIEGHLDDHGKSETFRLITTILDPDDASAVELAEAYHQRWELESTFREIETYLRAGNGIRSKRPGLVRQELWGLFLAHYAIRSFMAEAADTVEMDPDRISFTRTLHIVRRRITDPAVFSPYSRKTTQTTRNRRMPGTAEPTTEPNLPPRVQEGKPTHLPYEKT